MSGRPFTIIGAVIAVAALGIFVYLGSRAGGNIAAATVNLKPMVVAARDISVRVPLSAADLKVVQIDSAAIPPQSFTKVDELKGLIPVVGIYSGQPVTSNELVASADQLTGAQAGFLPIPKGWVAMTIPTSEQQGVAGFIQPGDYITISAIVAPGGKFENTRTVYTNIHVLRIGQAADTVVLTPVQVRGAVPTPAPKPPTATSMTVVVTQCQAEFLNWFIANATIKYTLESYKDYTPKDVAVDNSCPGVDSARGVTLVEVARNWPGLAS
jgi:Flp pilus assembly protein CpaB